MLKYEARFIIFILVLEMAGNLWYRVFTHVEISVKG